MAIENGEAFESAVARLPFPIFVIDDRSSLRPLNAYAEEVWQAEGLHAAQIERVPGHPLSLVITGLLSGKEGDDVAILQLGGTRYEVIHSTRSLKGSGRWLMLMLRPFPTALTVDRSRLSKRWSLTPREAEVAAECIVGRTTAEICELLAISRETLKTHMARLLDKAGCQNRSQLISKYLFGEL